jgi:hypothetical protein
LQEVAGNLVHLATVTSQVEALVIANALEHQGIPVWIDGAWHAAVDPISVALGGHRLRIPVSEWRIASSLVRELDLPGREPVYLGQRRAVLRFCTIYFGIHLIFGLPGLFMGLLPAAMLTSVPLSMLTIPIDP